MRNFIASSLLLLVAGLVLSNEASAQCVKMLTAGDQGTSAFGSELSQWMNRVAGASSSVAGCAVQASALLLLGDNFYEWGVSSTSDEKFTSLYESPFGLPNLQAIPEHWVTAGNHDHYNILAGTSAQKAYTNEGPSNSKWTFPSDYYTKSINQNGVKIFLVFTESWNLVGGDSWLPFQSSRIDQTQLRWVETQLASQEAQSADWLLVIGHFPVRSAYTAFPNRGDTSGLVRALEPLLKKYSVDAYISGHDHFHQIIDRKSMGYPIYYGNGASGKRDKGDINYNKRGLTFLVEDSIGFQSHVFTKTQMITTVHYKLRDGVERTQTYVQTQNQGPNTPFDCEQFSCGATCDQYKEFGCSWSSTANPPKFRGPGGKGTCVTNFDKDTSFWEKNDGVCTSSALLEAQVLATDEEMLAQNLTPGQIAASVVGTLSVVAGLVAMAVIYRRRSHIKDGVVRASQNFSARISARRSGIQVLEEPANNGAEVGIVATASTASDNPLFNKDADIRV